MHELIVGAGAANQFVGLSVGSSVKLPGGDWLIVGSFSSSHSLLESQLLTDVTTLMGSMRVSEYDSILVRMNPSADFDSFKNALTVLPDFQFEVDRERAYYIQRSQSFYTLLQVITYVIGSIIFAGAIVSALNTMYSVVRSRTVEIGTLRAIGFRGSIVAMGVLFEASLLGALGAMLGAAIAWFCFNGNTVSLLGGSNNTQLVIELTIPSSGLMNGILLGLLAGLAGGLLPAVSAARQPITKALREV
ncbi:MAG TPA: FtsX-like permease family protein [Steroidobacteraceae bacterium]|nr:FtsX-like permease family protein [Steroidobacteraceae bacterium]